MGNIAQLPVDKIATTPVALYLRNLPTSAPAGGDTAVQPGNQP